MSGAFEECAARTVPPGHMYNFVLAPFVKRMLLIPNLPPAEQLEGLEYLHSIADETTVAMFDPAGDIETKIISEALSIDRSFETVAESVAHGGSFKVLTSQRVFDGLCALNPSIMEAIRARFPIATTPAAAVDEAVHAHAAAHDEHKYLAALGAVANHGPSVTAYYDRK